MSTMNTELRLLLIEDSADDAALLLGALKKDGFRVAHFVRVETAEGLHDALKARPWDLVISDYSMPKFCGLTALRLVREQNPDIPFFLVSGSIGEDRAVEAMREGAQDFIMKDSLARLGPAIRRELEEFRRKTTQRETDQKLKGAEEKLRLLRRFFSPSVADLVASAQLEDPFRWHRKEVTVLFIDLRGFTSFVEVSEPEVVVEIVQEYYAEVGKVVQGFSGTIGHVAGDGIMIFLNDPIDVPKHQEKALEMALELRRLLSGLQDKWRRHELELSFGAGLASGFASIGGLGAEGCWDYSVIGTVTNVAARLCAEAKAGQILISHRFLSGASGRFDTDPVGDIQLKGIQRSIAAYNVLQMKS